MKILYVEIPQIIKLSKSILFTCNKILLILLLNCCQWHAFKTDFRLKVVSRRKRYSLSENFSANRGKLSVSGSLASPLVVDTMKSGCRCRRCWKELLRFRGNEKRDSMMKYSVYCATVLAIFYPYASDTTSYLPCARASRYRVFEELLSKIPAWYV